MSGFKAYKAQNVAYKFLHVSAHDTQQPNLTSMATRNNCVCLSLLLRLFSLKHVKSVMPPKKNGKGRGDALSNKKEGIEPEQKKREELTESDKNFYRAQIRDLEERLER